MDEPIDPRMGVDEQTTLVEFLDFYRVVLLRKIDGLTDAQARTAACPPSPLNIMGLVRHMAEVERNWFRRVFAAEDAPPIFYTDHDPDGDMFPQSADTVTGAVSALADEIGRARIIVNLATPDALSAAPRHDEYPSMRWILVHMIEEYSRHCGHADLIREAIDGVTGD